LRAFLKEKLPEYMIPSSLHEVKEFPRNVNGKIDRRVLPMLVEHPQDQLPVPEDLMTHTEQALADLWSSLLDVGQISLDDDFLELGGDSLTAMQCVHRLHDVLGVEIPVDVFFAESAKIRELAKLIDELRSEHLRAIATGEAQPQFGSGGNLSR